jgi:hypothetical protein
MILKKVKLLPVWHNGTIQLFDIFIFGVWHGSRRTRKQCREYVRTRLGDEGREAAAGLPDGDKPHP